MVEFTVRVDDHPAIRLVHDRVSKVRNVLFGVESTIRPKDGKLIWTLDVMTVQITVYLTVVSLIVTSFAFWYFNFPIWVFSLPALFLTWNFASSAFYWRWVFRLAVFKQGYRGEFRVLHSEGLL